MLEEKNDNLPSADGIQENNSQDVNNVVIIDENESSIDDVVINEVNHDTQTVEEIVDSIETVDEISNDDVEIISINDLKHSLETDVVDTDSTLIEKSEVETIESNELTSIENEIDFNDLLDSLKSQTEAMVFDVNVIENENCYPMVTPGRSNSQMLGLEKQETADLQEVNN